MFLARILSNSALTLIRQQTILRSVPLVQSLAQQNRFIRLESFKFKETEGDEAVNVKDSTKDRTKVIPVETSIRYLHSKAYKTTYGTDPVWKLYRRNHKGGIPTRKTRKTCIRGGIISTGNPCPICRDEYLVLHPENIELLKQFISPYTGDIISYSTTGICQKRHKELLIAIEIAKDRGLITFDVPFREYDYSEYIKSKA